MKKFLFSTLAALVLTGTCNFAIAGEQVSSDEALQMLKDGNERYVKGAPEYPHLDSKTRMSLTDSQSPFAVVLSCVDSRVPTELVFDRGLGDMLTIRTAGQALDDAALGSIEFGVGVLKSPLLVVLGHENCGAVAASIDAVDNKSPLPGSIQSLADFIKPAVDETRGKSGDRLVNTVDANVSHVIATLKKSPIIAAALNDGSLKIVGGVYDLDTGKIKFHDGGHGHHHDHDHDGHDH